MDGINLAITTTLKYYNMKIFKPEDFPAPVNPVPNPLARIIKLIGDILIPIKGKGRI